VSARLPTVREAQQLCRLRSLRVQRARERAAAAQADVEAAVQSLRTRQARVAELHRELALLREQIAHALAPQLPRWGAIVDAQRERIADRIEREEYAVIDDERRLEQAEEALQAARAEVTRALAREDAVQGVADASKRARRQGLERRSDAEIDDALAGAAARGGLA